MLLFLEGSVPEGNRLYPDSGTVKGRGEEGAQVGAKSSGGPLVKLLPRTLTCLLEVTICNSFKVKA